MKFEVTGGNKGATFFCTDYKNEDDILYVNIKMRLDHSEVPKKFSVSWKVPVIDCYSVWSPRKGGGNLAANWGKNVTASRLASGMPLHTVLALSGKNQITITLSDAASPIEIGTGVCEEDACLDCCVDFFTVPVEPLQEYEALIRIDQRNIPYYDCIYDSIAWWEKECGYCPSNVPEYARLPMNSLWYSYHKLLDADDIINECRLSKEIGMDTVIVDDGWYTEDINRGFAFCGDWKVANKKIPDMKDFVKRVHETGMKIMLWYSVPFMGCKSKNYDRFKNMLLDETCQNNMWWALDPRYKEVRDFLIDTYVKAVSEWGLDGLKLDFIDSFVLKGKSLEYDEKRDYQSLEDAVDRLMTDIMEVLTKINPEILIEFRQSYVGPAIRKYGNMLRVADCPNDGISNRKGVVNLRLTSGNTAVHSDMLMWNYEEPVEYVALQLAGVLYAVPQISMKIARLNKKHRKMLEFYLRFWRENQETLLDGKIIALNPESNYSLVCAEKDNKAIFTAYTDRVIPERPGKHIIAVNATGGEELIFKGYKGASYRVVNCMGETLDEKLFEENIVALSVPLAGMVYVAKIEQVSN